MWSLNGWIQYAGVCVTVEKENIMTELKQTEQFKEYSLHYIFSGSVEAAPHFINFNSNVNNVFYMMLSTELWGVRTHKVSVSWSQSVLTWLQSGQDTFNLFTCSSPQIYLEFSWNVFFLLLLCGTSPCLSIYPHLFSTLCLLVLFLPFPLVISLKMLSLFSKTINFQVCWTVGISISFKVEDTAQVIPYCFYFRQIPWEKSFLTLERCLWLSAPNIGAVPTEDVNFTK